MPTTSQSMEQPDTMTWPTIITIIIIISRIINPNRITRQTMPNHLRPTFLSWTKSLWTEDLHRISAISICFWMANTLHPCKAMVWLFRHQLVRLLTRDRLVDQWCIHLFRVLWWHRFVRIRWASDRSSFQLVWNLRYKDEIWSLLLFIDFGFHRSRFRRTAGTPLGFRSTVEITRNYCMEIGKKNILNIFFN